MIQHPTIYRKDWLKSLAPKTKIVRLPQPTEQQGQAVEILDKDIVVSAGAGSGKTWVLAQRYIEILNQGCLPEEIVAITFTEKAAAEMKARIRKEISKMANKAISANEQTYWEEVKDQLETAIITTIHGFCARILRENPIELGIDPDFYIIEAVEGQFLLTEIFQAGVEKWLESGDTRVPFIYQLYPSKNDIIAILKSMHAVMRTYRLYKEDILVETRYSLDQQREQFKGKIEKLRKVNSELAIVVNDRIAQGGDVKDYLLQAQLWTNKVERMQSMLLAWDGFYDEAGQAIIKVLSNPPKRQRTKDNYYPLVCELHEIMEDIQKLVVSPEYETILSALLDLLEQIDQEYQQAKKRLRGLDFGDMEMLTAKLLIEHESIRNKWQMKLKYIAVDEFQDTNGLQKKIIQALLGKEVRLFVVGDPKQSIYKFRGADVSIFYETEKEILQRDGTRITLATNFRTQKRIIEYINHLFQFLLNPEEDAPSYFVRYEGLEAFRSAPQGEACVEMIPILIENGNEERDEEEENQKWREIEAERIAYRIKEMVDGREKRVWRALDPGEFPPDNTPSYQEGDTTIYCMPVRFRDIAILFSATTQMYIYEQALQDYGIPYDVRKGRTFYTKQEVLDIINLLQVLYNPLDEVALLGFLRSPMGQIHDESLFWLTRAQSLYQAVYALGKKPAEMEEDQWQEILQLRNWLGKWKQLIDFRPLAQVVRIILDDTGYGEMLLGSQHGERKAANVQKVIQLVKTWVDEKGMTLFDFIQTMERIKDEEVKEEEGIVYGDMGNVVPLMTIHASKGLEFPVVILPELNRDFTSGAGFRGNHYYHPGKGLGLKLRRGQDKKPVGDGLFDSLREIHKEQELQEERRKLYVALTRARDYLILAAAQKPTKKQTDELKNTWTDWMVKHLGYMDISELMDKEIHDSEDGSWSISINHRVPETKRSGSYVENPSTNGTPVAASIEDLHARFPYFAPIGHGKNGRSFPSLSVSALMNYAECPRRFYIQNYIGIDDSFLNENVNLMQEEPIDLFQEELEVKGSLLGNIVHRILEHPPVCEEVDQTIMKEVIQEEVLGDRLSLIEQIRPYITNYLNSKYHQGVLEGKYQEQSEIPFHYYLSDQIISGIIDKLFIDKDGKAILIDFKTNHLKDQKHLDQLIEQYSVQAYLYTIVVQEVMRIEVKEFILYFLEQDQPVSLNIQPEQLTKVKEKLSKAICHIQSHHRIEDYPICGESYCVCSVCGA